jgi:long-subunit fatty acid transport protein
MKEQLLKSLLAGCYRKGCTSAVYGFTFALFSMFMLSLFCFTEASAQLVEISASLNPVGSGARATGMGGAFIAVADDATAASWNPAGLVQLEKPEISAVYAYFYRKQKYESSEHPEAETTNSMDTNGLNYASAAYPFVLFNRNMIISVNYQRLYELNKDLQFNYDVASGTKGFYSFEQKGYLYALSPAVAVQVTPSFYLGATLNIWDDLLGDNGWENTLKARVKDSFFGVIRETTRTSFSFQGMNAHAGFLWNFHERFTLGGVIKTPFNAVLKKERSSVFRNGGDVFKESEKERLKMKMPMSYGLGLAYRHSDAWTVALDVYRTDWSRFALENEDGKETNPITGASLSEGRLKDTTQVRLGTEYLFIREKDVIPLRFGLCYDPEPRTGSLDDYYGFSLGTGYARGRIAFDISYQYRFGRNVTADIPLTTADIDQHTVMASLIFHF